MKKINITRNFYTYEFACKDQCGKDYVEFSLVSQLQRFRDLLWINTGKEIFITVTCGFRCEEHNNKVGGYPRSSHMVGMAADIYFRGLSFMKAGRLALLANKFGIMNVGGIGVYPKRFMHLDVRASDTRGNPTTWIKRNGIYTYGVRFT